MKRDSLKSLITTRLTLMGYARRSFYWVPKSCTLLVNLNGELWEFPFRANMSKRDLGFELGRLAMLAEIAGLVTHASQTPPHTARHNYAEAAQLSTGGL